jgi:hypothetical protein
MILVWNRFVLICRVSFRNLDEFIEYFKYVKGLQFDDKPDYKYLNNLFQTIMNNFEFKNDFNFDWTEKVIDLNIERNCKL